MKSTGLAVPGAYVAGQRYPEMEVLTMPIRKTSTCLTLLRLPGPDYVLLARRAFCWLVPPLRLLGLAPGKTLRG